MVNLWYSGRMAKDVGNSGTHSTCVGTQLVISKGKEFGKKLAQLDQGSVFIEQSSRHDTTANPSLKHIAQGLCILTWYGQRLAKPVESVMKGDLFEQSVAVGVISDGPLYFVIFGSEEIRQGFFRPDTDPHVAGLFHLVP